ncbi:MAG TPA: four helix bundle protein [Flavisolibacter sp.]|nr:four helix bundle protein [Flavisolibacter sp.]
MNTKTNPIIELTFDFSLELIKYTEILEKSRKYSIANLLLRAGTSIGANVHEAQSAESKSDFINKMKIASKEAEETKYWLMLCLKSDNYPNPLFLLNKIEIIIKILGKIISSSKKTNI